MKTYIKLTKKNFSNNILYSTVEISHEKLFPLSMLLNESDPHSIIQWINNNDLTSFQTNEVHIYKDQGNIFISCLFDDTKTKKDLSCSTDQFKHFLQQWKSTNNIPHDSLLITQNINNELNISII